MVDYNSIIEGTVKFRDGKKWKSRWCVMRKLSPVADCLHLQLYRDSKDRYKQGQTKASLSLQHFLGVESGFTLDKESNTIAIVCQDVTVILAFDTRERLIQWQVKISNNLGEDQQFLIQITSSPAKAKIANGPARLHVQDHRFSITSGVPPRLMGYWEIGYLRRYGVVEGRFCFEGGSRCGKGEGLHVCVSDQGEEITHTIKMASQGKLATRRRPLARKVSAMDSPRKQMHSRPETRFSDVMDQTSNYPSDTLNRSMCSEDGTFCGCSQDVPDSASRHQSSDDLLCPCRMHRGRCSPFWPSTESATGHHGNAELDSNYGCGDTASVSDPQEHDSHWSHDSMPYERRGLTALERCASCISKLGAPSMSRSSTVTHTNTPSTPFSPAWTMEPIPSSCHHHARSNGSDRVSLSSHSSSEYSVPRFVNNSHDCARTTPPPHHHPPSVPPKSPKTVAPQCCPPHRPPKPQSMSDSPQKKKPKKPPMPLPTPPPPQTPISTCTCHQMNNSMVGPYENYDVPKPLLGHNAREEPNGSSAASDEYYDTPKNIKEALATTDAQYGNYDTPKVLACSKPCGCIVTLNKKGNGITVTEDDLVQHGGDCPCQRVMCWAENWMMLPYCRRGNGMENTGVPIHNKVKLSGEGKMPVMNTSGEIAIYATVDKTKKTNRRNEDAACSCAPIAGDSAQDPNDPPTSDLNYANVEPISETNNCNYQNLDFENSLEYYENSKDLLQRAGISQQEIDSMAKEFSAEVSYSMNNGVKFCNKCGHSSNEEKEEPPEPSVQGPSTDVVKKQDDYLMMEPTNKTPDRNHPGYIPMSPIAKLMAFHKVEQKAASVTSLAGPYVDRSRKRSDYEFHRVSGSAMMMNHSANSPYLRRLLVDNDERKLRLLSRKRSSSADSSRYLEDFEELEKLGRRESVASIECSSPKKESLNCSEETIVQDLATPSVAETIPDDVSVSSDSLRTLIREPQVTSPSVHIRRSSSVPCKSGNNRDSSSSNDSGVSTGSLKHRGADFAEFELPLTTSMSSRRHHHAVSRHPNVLANCLHGSLPRRSKSVDPLRELTFHFQKVKIPTKSSSAEAEVPVCPTKRETAKGFASPGTDGTTPVPYMDSRSTSSGTSDMSDYIETLSLSSHSSSDTPDSLRLMRPATTTLRPRSGKEYQLIDRDALKGQAIEKNQQYRGMYANTSQVPEKAKTPSSGYITNSNSQEREDQPLL